MKYSEFKTHSESITDLIWFAIPSWEHQLHSDEVKDSAVRHDAAHVS